MSRLIRGFSRGVQSVRRQSPAWITRPRFGAGLLLLCLGLAGCPGTPIEQPLPLDPNNSGSGVGAPVAPAIALSTDRTVLVADNPAFVANLFASVIGLNANNTAFTWSTSNDNVPEPQRLVQIEPAGSRAVLRVLNEANDRIERNQKIFVNVIATDGLRTLQASIELTLQRSFGELAVIVSIKPPVRASSEQGPVRVEAIVSGGSGDFLYSYRVTPPTPTALGTFDPAGHQQSGPLPPGAPITNSPQNFALFTPPVNTIGVWSIRVDVRDQESGLVATGVGDLQVTPASIFVSLTPQDAVQAPSAVNTLRAEVTGGTGTLSGSNFIFEILAGSPGASIALQNVVVQPDGRTVATATFTPPADTTGVWSIRVNVTDVVGEQAFANATITVAPYQLSLLAPTTSVSPNRVLRLVADITGGTGPYQLNWNPGGGSLQAGNIQTAPNDQQDAVNNWTAPSLPGIYTVSVQSTDALGLTRTSSVEITVVAAFAVDVTSGQFLLDPAAAPPASDAIVTATVQDGAPGFRYVWSVAGDTTATGGFVDSMGNLVPTITVDRQDRTDTVTWRATGPGKVNIVCTVRDTNGTSTAIADSHFLIASSSPTLALTGSSVAPIGGIYPLSNGATIQLNLLTGADPARTVGVTTTVRTTLGTAPVVSVADLGLELAGSRNLLVTGVTTGQVELEMVAVNDVGQRSAPVIVLVGVNTPQVNSPDIDPGSLAPPGPYVIRVGETLNIQLTTSDPNPGDFVGVLVSGQQGSGGATAEVAAADLGLAAPGARVLSITGVKAGTSIPITLTAVDNTGLLDPTPVVIMVQVNTNLPPNIAPDILPIPPGGTFIIPIGTTQELTLTTLDDPPGSALAGVVVAGQTPANPLASQVQAADLSLAPPGERRLLITGTRVGSPIPITLTAVDEQGAVDPTPSFITVQVVNNAPQIFVVEPLAPLSVQVGQTSNILVRTVDADGHDVGVQVSVSPFGGPFDSQIAIGDLGMLPPTGIAPGGPTRGIPLTGLFAGISPLTVTLTPVDAFGQTGTPATVTVSVTPVPVNQAPNIDPASIAPAGPLSVGLGQTLYVQLTTTDPDFGDAVGVSVTGQQGGFVSVSDLGLLAPGTRFLAIKGLAAGGPVSLTLTAIDDKGLADLSPPTITVTVPPAPVNQPPSLVLGSPANVSVQKGETIYIPLTTADTPGQLVSVLVSGQDGTGPAVAQVVAADLGLDVPGGRVLSVTGARAGTDVTLTLLPRDNAGLGGTPVSLTVQVTPVPVNNRPDITSVVPGNISVGVGQTVSVDLTTADIDLDEVRVSVTGQQGGGGGTAQVTASNLPFAPPGTRTLQITGVQAGTPITLTLTAIDDKGLADLTPATLLVTVTPLPANNPPDIAPIPPGTITLGAGQSVQLPIDTIDADGDLVSVAVSGLAGPPGSTIVDVDDLAPAAPGPRVLTIRAVQPGTPITLTLTAADSRGALDPAPTTISVQVLPAPVNQAPSMTSVVVPGGQPLLLGVGQTVNIDVTTADPDAGQLIAIVASQNNPANPALTAVAVGDPGFDTPGLRTVSITGVRSGSEITISLVAIDQFFAASAPVTVRVQVQAVPANQPPSITLPVGDPILTGGITIGRTGTIPLTVADPDADQVRVLVEGDGINATISDLALGPAGVRQLALTAVATGGQPITLTPMDARGLAGTPVSFTLTVNNAAPQVFLADPILGSFNVAVGQTVAVPIRLIDADNHLTGAIVTVTPKGGLLESRIGVTSVGLLPPTGLIETRDLLLHGVSAGLNPLTVTITPVDQFGLTGTSASFQVNVTALPTNAPPQIVQSANTSVVIGRVQNFTITTADADGEAVGVVVSGAGENAVISDLATGPAGNRTLTIQGIAMGTRTITLTPVDARGLAGTPVNFNVTVTNNAPSVFVQEIFGNPIVVTAGGPAFFFTVRTFDNDAHDVAVRVVVTPSGGVTESRVAIADLGLLPPTGLFFTRSMSVAGLFSGVPDTLRVDLIPVDKFGLEGNPATFFVRVAP